MLHPPSGPSEGPPAGEAGAAAHWSVDAELMHALTENLPLGLFVFDAQSHRLVALNAQAEHDFGLRRDAVVGQLAPQALGPALCALVEPGLHQAARGHSAAEHDFEWRAGVTPRHFSARHVVVRHADGSARLVLVMLRDTTAVIWNKIVAPTLELFAKRHSAFPIEREAASSTPTASL